VIFFRNIGAQAYLPAIYNSLNLKIAKYDNYKLQLQLKQYKMKTEKISWSEAEDWASRAPEDLSESAQLEPVA